MFNWQVTALVLAESISKSKRPGAKYANLGLCRDMMKRSAFLRSVHYTESILLAQADIVKKKSGKFLQNGAAQVDAFYDEMPAKKEKVTP